MWSGVVRPAENVSVWDGRKHLELSEHSPGAVVLEASQDFSIKEAQAKLADSPSSPSGTCSKTCWVAYPIENALDEDQDLSLSGNADLSQYWVLRNDGTALELRPEGAVGAQVSTAGDPYSHLVIHKGERLTLLTRHSYAQIFAWLNSPRTELTPYLTTLVRGEYALLLAGFLLGGLAVLGLYNLLIAMVSKERSYLWYCAYLFLMSISSTSAGGGNLISFVFSPRNPTPGVIFAELAGGLMWIALIGFIRNFLDTRVHVPRLDRLLVIPVALLLLSLLLGFANEAHWVGIAYCGDCLTPLVGIVIALARLRQGFRPASYVLFAQLVVGAGMLLQTGFDFGFVDMPSEGWPRLIFHNSAWIGSLVEAILFSLALADRIRSLKHTVNEQTLLHLQDRERLINAQKDELVREVDQRTKELQQEKQRSDRLLLSVLPEEIAEELKTHGQSIPRRYDDVSVLFTDFRNFTTTVSALPADRLVAELNDIFQVFDEILVSHGVEKIKTIGDSYMVVSGLPQVVPNHAERCVLAALDMLKFMKRRNENSAIKWGMRAGIHSGSVVAGIVGKTKFAYDVFGDTVNIASRMESNSEPGRLNVSAYTYDLVKESFIAQYRGKVDVKGKGEIDMYFIDEYHLPLVQTSA